NGAVATTLIAGVELMKRGLVPRVGMITERTDARITETLHGLLDFAPLEDLVFGGWDVRFANAYEGAVHHRVLPPAALEAVRHEIEAVRPWPAVFARAYAENVVGENVVKVGSHLGELGALERDIDKFKREHRVEQVVMVNLASTEAFLAVTDVHRTLAAFER